MAKTLNGRTVAKHPAPGTTVFEREEPFRLVDGDLTVEVEWHDDATPEHAPGYWVARLVDAGEANRTVRYSPMADGRTKEEALAHLAIATYVGLIEDTPDA